MIDLRIEERIFESKEISFAIRADDQRAADLIGDAPLVYGGDRYFIYKVKNALTKDGVRLKKVFGEINWMRLADRKRAGNFILEDQTATQGAEAILSGTGWTLDYVSDEITGTASMEANDLSVLALVWDWCRVVGAEPIWNSMEKTLSLVPFAGSSAGVSFRYGRDVEEIEKEEEPPIATRVFPFGRDDLNVSAIAGASYIEDFSWYTAQGITLEEARAEYTKDEVFYDDSMIEDAPLYRAGVKFLEKSSKPTIKYKAKVIDLSTLTSLPAMTGFQTGDMATVYDEDVQLEVDARVTRRVEFPLDPSLNEVELSFNAVLLPESSVASGRPNTTRSWELFVSRNDLTARQIRGFSTILHRIKLRTSLNAEWVMGYSLTGTAVGSSQMTLEFTDDETGLPVWETQVVDLVDGQPYDYAWTFGRKEIPAGTTTVVVRAYTDTPGAGLDIDFGGTALWVLARGTTRQTVTLPNSQTFNFNGNSTGLNGTVQLFVVPDDVFEILVEARGGSGGDASQTYRGLGGMVKARIPVTPGETLYVYVGGAGAGGGTSNQVGAWPNGGGTPESAAGNVSGGDGGGSTHLLRADTFDATNCLICAAGGGGVNQQGSSRNSVAEGITAGDGGFYQGKSGNGYSGNNYDDGDVTNVGGGGATQTSGGLAGVTGGGSGVAGAFNDGGEAAGTGNSFHFAGGGGGGGFYGGGGAGAPVLYGGGSYAGDGGGGCGWLAPGGYDLEFEDGANLGNGQMIISWETPEDLG